MRRSLGIALLAAAALASGACARHGREVFAREGCVNCHRFRDLGTPGALDLSDVGSRRDAAWIGVQIRTPAAHNPDTRMPPFPRIGGFDLKSLVAYLRS